MKKENEIKNQIKIIQKEIYRKPFSKIANQLAIEVQALRWVLNKNIVKR